MSAGLNNYKFYPLNLMSFLTIFTAPKPFTNPHIAIIQRNAIRSWMQLGEKVQVLLIGDEAGLGETAQELNLPHRADILRNSSGTPLVSSIFSLARETSPSPYLAYINADILLFPDFLTNLQQLVSALEIQEILKPFLLIGQRWDLDITHEIDFQHGWEQRLQTELDQKGSLHPPAGSDYFIFPRSAFTNMPDFAIGRAGWDNWMIYHARQQGWLVIDGTPSFKIVHQKHDYSHLPGGKPHYDLAESQVNMDLAGGLANMYTVLDTDHQWSKGRLQPAPLTKLRVVRRLERWFIPKNGELRGLQGGFARRLRRWRRKLERSA